MKYLALSIELSIALSLAPLADIRKHPLRDLIRHLEGKFESLRHLLAQLSDIFRRWELVIPRIHATREAQSLRWRRNR